MSSAGPPIQRVATEPDSGRSCPYCRFTFKAGIPLIDCPACHAPHHADCWTDNKGCAVLGCPAAPRDTAAPTGGASSLPPATPRPPIFIPPDLAPVAQRVPYTPPLYTPAPGGYTPAPPGAASASGGRSQKGLIAAVLAVAAAVVVLIVILVVHKGSGSTGGLQLGGSTSSTNSTAQSGTSSSSTSSTSSSTSRTTTSSQHVVSVAQEQNAIVAVLQSYESAYSHQNLAELGSLFTPEVSRHGLRAGGCSDTRGKQQVLSTYAEQFASGAENYDLTDLSARQIAVDGRHAQAPLSYDISTTSGPAIGSVEFYLAQLNGTWLIQRIVASC
jgi:hypothetical protein